MNIKLNRCSVLIVIDEWEHPAGTELYVCDLVKGLVGKGCLVTLCVLSGIKSVPSKDNVFCDVEGMKVVYLDEWNELTDLIKRNSYDVVHNHLYSSLLKAIWYERRVKPRPKIVNTWHLALSAWGYKVYFMWLASIIFSDITVGVAKHVFLTKHGFDLLSLFNRKCHFVYYCPKIPNVEIININRNKFIVCGCGRLSKEKNWITLLKAINQIKKFEDAELTDLEVILLGDGSDRFFLESYIKKHDLGSIVTLKGRVIPAQVFNYMRNSDVIVLPSMHEAFPLVIVEAMSLGVCVLVSNIPVSREVFGSDFESYTFAFDDYKDLARKIVRLKATGTLRKNCIEFSKYKYKQICTTNITEFYFDIYLD